MKMAFTSPQRQQGCHQLLPARSASKGAFDPVMSYHAQPLLALRAGRLREIAAGRNGPSYTRPV